MPFIARWPGVTPREAVCDQLATLGDFIRTCADMMNVSLPEGEAEDSVSILPLLQGATDTVVRDTVVHHSCSGKFGIRKGRWVFIDAPSGDDNREPDWFKEERGYTLHDYPGELFDLQDDISERRNLYGERPAIVRELSGLLDQIKGADRADEKPIGTGTPESE